MPRLWRGFGGPVGYFGPESAYVDGDRTTFSNVLFFGAGGCKMAAEFYTIDPGAPLPLYKFVLQEPPEELVDQFGRPFATYIPNTGS